MGRIFWALVAVFLLITATLAAGPQPKTHDGFFLRMLPGIGYAESVEEDVLGEDFTLSGSTGIFLFQIGGAVANNMILYGEFGGNTMTDPEVEWAGMTVSTDETSLSVFGVGIGLGYYFMPGNIYVSASINMSQVTLEVDGESSESDPGIGTWLMVGKEWWVGKRANWGLGLALAFHYSVVEAEDFGETHDVRNLATGLAFSATLN